MELIYPNRKAKRIITIASILLLAVALTQPAFYVGEETHTPWSSAAAFFFGWFGVFCCKAGISWLANLCLVSAWLNMKGNPQRASIASFLAIIFALTFLMAKTIMVDEAGHMGGITGLAPGYYLWIASMVVCLAGAIAMWIMENSGGK